jgi:hypothetical protein
LSLLASMLATRTFRPSVVVLIWSVVALTTFLISSRTALCAFLAFLNAFPPSSRVDLRAALLSIRAALTAVLPSAVAGFVAVQLLLQVFLSLMHLCSQFLLILLHRDKVRRFDAARSSTVSPHLRSLANVFRTFYGHRLWAGL